MTTDQPRPDAADSRQSLTLNYYGELARRQWEGCLPEIYQQIRDPGAFLPDEDRPAVVDRSHPS